MSVVLSEHLPLLASAPDGIQKLRGLILGLAVRGKLVPQDLNDEPASELLKRIAQERARPEAEGGFKKSKPLPPVGEDERPYAVPDGWQWARLSELLERLSNGYTGAQSKSPTPYPLTRIETISKSAVNFEKVGYCSAISERDVEKFRLKAGDILLSHINSDLHVGKTALYAEERLLIHGVNLLLLRPFQFVCQRYLDLAINSHRLTGYFLRIAQHAIGQSSINQGKLSLVPIALPPLAEQWRIVAKVDELMALCDRLEAEQADAASAHAQLVETLLGTLTQSTDAADLAANWQRLAEHFDTLFTTEASIEVLKQTVLQLAVMGKLVSQDARDEPASALLQRLPKPKKALAPIDEGELLFEIPKNWQWARFGEVFVGGSGTTPARARRDYFEAGTEYWVKTTDLNNALVTTCEELITPQAVSDCNLTYFPTGTVCIAMYGGAGTIGKTGVLGIESTINQSVFALPPVTGISPAFTHYYLKSIRGVWMRFAAGLRVAANINGQIIKSMVFPVPPVNEQNRIVAKVDELMAICDRLKADLASANERQATLADTLIESALEAA